MPSRGGRTIRRARMISLCVVSTSVSIRPGSPVSSLSKYHSRPARPSRSRPRNPRIGEAIGPSGYWRTGRGSIVTPGSLTVVDRVADSVGDGGGEPFLDGDRSVAFGVDKVEDLDGRHAEERAERDGDPLGLPGLLQIPAGDADGIELDRDGERAAVGVEDGAPLGRDLDRPLVVPRRLLTVLLALDPLELVEAVDEQEGATEEQGPEQEDPRAKGAAAGLHGCQLPRPRAVAI